MTGRRLARPGPTLFDAATPGASASPNRAAVGHAQESTAGARTAGRITARALALGLQADLDIDGAAGELHRLAGGDASPLWLALRRVERSDAGQAGVTERASRALRRALEMVDHRMAS